jgi:CheY-like chemotaxis protein
VPRHPPDQPFELEYAQRGHDLAGGHAGAGDQVVDRGWPVVYTHLAVLHVRGIERQSLSAGDLDELREFEAQMGIRNWFRPLLRAKTEGGIPSPEVGRDLFDSSGPDSFRPEERPRHTLLIVDDETDILNTLRHQFRKTYFVLTACSAAAAVELLAQNDVHVIISDQRMPGMSGDVFLRHARRIRPNAIRILFTGYADIQAVIKAVDEGDIFRYILKPWDATELEGIIRQAAEQYDLVTERDRLQTELETLKNPSVPATAHVKEDQVIGTYRLQKKLGEGGMGAVYKAIHLPLNRIVAFKVLAPDRLHDAEAIARFLREIKAVGSLHHPNIVQGTDAGEADGIHFLVMEFVDGINLSDLVLRRGPLSIPDSCELIAEAAIGVHHAHEHGLVHRDLKPSNLMLTHAGCIKVLDFGLARLYEGATTVTDLTSSGQILGTIGYMAPEQAFAKYAVSSRTDVYSLGCTLYKFLTGRTPFSGPAYDTPAKILLAHALEPVPLIQHYRPEVSPELAAILNRLLAKDPADRFESAADVVAALGPFRAGADLSKLLPSPGLSTTVDWRIASS